MKGDAVCTSSTRPVDITTLSLQKTQKACKAVCIKDNSALDSLSYYHTVGSLSPMHKRFIQLHSIHSSRQSSLYYPHTSPTLVHPLTPIQSPPLTQWSLPSCFSLVFLVMRMRQPDLLIGLCREIPGKPLPPFMFIAKHEYPISRLACILHQTKTWLNRHFRCAGSFLTLDSLYRPERQTRVDKVF